MLPDWEKLENVNWLEWLIKFLNADLDSINGRERFRLFFELDDFRSMSPTWINVLGDGSFDSLLKAEIPTKLFEDMLNLQKQLRIFLNDTIELYDTEKSHQEEDGFTTIKRRIFPALLFFPSFGINPDGKFRLDFVPFDAKMASSLQEIGEMMGIDFEPLQKKRPVKEHESEPYSELSITVKDLLKEKIENPSMGKIEEYLLSVCKVLDGLPVKWVRKCKGCDRFFLNPTDRDKIYCNSSCASRSIARMKREKLYKDPKKHEAYKKKMKRIMRKRYDEMRKTKRKGRKKIRSRKLRNSILKQISIKG